MKLALWISVAVGGLLTLVLVVGFLLSDNYEVSRSRTIPLPAGELFDAVDEVKSWEQWTVWNSKTDPGMKWEYSGPPRGVGATVKWSSEQSGSGQRVVTESRRPEHIAFDLSFGDWKPAKGLVTFDAAGERSTTVTWTMKGNFGGSPIARYFGLFIDTMAGPDFERNLEQLEGYVKSR